MKHILKPAKIKTLMFIVLTFTMISSGCARMSRSTNAKRADLSETNAPLHINVNTASAKELEELPGIGPVIAERIVAYREQNGRFKRREELMMVSGVSEKKYEEIRSMILVE
ncbi:MAG: helix-hairpin-helix domain-containing protein [bacterium]